MISRIAKINNGYLKYMAYRLYDMKSRLIILCICGVLGFPLVSLAAVVTENINSNLGMVGGAEFFLLVSIMLGVTAAIIVGLLTYSGGVSCFDYYSRREKVDKSWSLPVTNRQRFWGDFTAGIAPIVIVYALTAGIGLAILNAGLKRATGEEIAMTEAMMFAGLLTLIAVYIVAVFCAALCGRVFETVVYPALICGIVPALVGLFGMMTFMNVWQVEIYQQLNTVLAATSPGGFIGVFFHELFAFYNRDLVLVERLIFLKPGIMLPFVIVHGGILTAAYYLGKKRKAEDTGKPFVFKAASEIILSFVVFCIVAVFCYAVAYDVSLTPGVIFGMVTCTAIAFLMLDVSNKRGFKRMGRAFFRYAIMFTGSVIVSNILLAANGFGAGDYVPPVNRIQSVSIDANFMDSFKVRDANHWSRFSLIPQPQFTDAETIELLRNLNIASNENPHNSLRYMMEFWDRHVYVGGGWRWHQQRITYTLNNGNTVTRLVRLNDPQIETLLALILADDYKQNQLSYIDKWLEDKEDVRTSATVTSLSQERISHGEGNVDALRIYEAFKKDYLAETFAQRFHSTQPILGKLEYSFAEMALMPDGRTHMVVNSIAVNNYIFAHYTNLIAELERQGLDIWNGASERYFIPASFVVAKADYIGGNYETAQNINWNWHHFQRDDKTSELLDILLRVAQPSYLIRDEGYFLIVSGNQGHGYYVIPPSFSHIAAELRSIVVAETSVYGHHHWYGYTWADEFGDEFERWYYWDDDWGQEKWYDVPVNPSDDDSRPMTPIADNNATLLLGA
jgi:hypothetical protein